MRPFRGAELAWCQSSLLCVLFIENQKDTLANGYPWPKSRGEKFFMEQKLRFGLKKNWANYEQLLRAVVSCFHGHFFFKYCSVHTKKLHRMKVRKPKQSLKFNYELKIGSETYSIVSCSTGDTSSRDLCIMTLPLANHSCVGLFYFF